MVICANTMKIMRRRWILISSLCSGALLWTLFTLDFQYLLLYKDIQQRKYNIFQYELPYNIYNDTLVDLQDFEYVMNNISLCSSSAQHHPSIVIVVHTARSHFSQRYAIRNTWGSIKVYKGWIFHLAFLLGSDPTSTVQCNGQLWEESKQHGDLIMGSFVDSYKNLTYKHLMGYKWVTTFCANTKFILKTDDDIYVDIFELVEVILVELTNSENTYACLNMRGNKPVRNPDSVWYVSEALYPEEEYPDFCSGSAYVMKSSDAAKIYSVCNQTKFLWIDDVFVTGLLRENYNFLINNSDNAILSLNSQYNLTFKDGIRSWCNTGMESNQLKYTFVLFHKNDVVRDMFCVWNKVRLLKFAMNNAIPSEAITEINGLI